MKSKAEMYARRGYSVIPTDRDSKRPICKWDRYKGERAAIGVVRQWWSRTPAANIAVVCGKVSGGLQVIDFDHEAERVFKQWSDEIPGYLAHKLPVVRTGKGFHVWFRARDDVRRSTKLSMDEERRVLIELKGEGGYVIAPPSWHASAQREYAWMYGSERRVPLLTAREVNILLHAAGCFDKFGVARARKLKEARERRKLEQGPVTGPHRRGSAQDVRDAIDMVAFARYAWGGDVKPDSDTEVRVYGQGGLLINTEKRVWHCHSDSVGGDALDLVGYSMYLNAWDRSGSMFREALQKAANFAGIDL